MTSEQIRQQVELNNYGIAYWTARQATFNCWVWAYVASRARISLYSSATHVYSSYHTGDSTWQRLSITVTVGTTNLYAVVHVDTGDTVAYFDGATMVEGASAFAFAPKPVEDGVWIDYLASSTVVGITGTVGGGIRCLRIGKLLLVHYALSGTSNSADFTFTLPYNAIGSTHEFVGRATDNGGIGLAMARCYILANTNIVVALKDADGNGFTDSGTKSISGLLFIEVS
jgi:hypothetical protein